MRELSHDIPDDQFTRQELRALHTIDADDPELGAYFGFPDIQKHILATRPVEQEFADKRAAAAQRQELLDNTWYAGPGGLTQRKALYPQPNEAEPADSSDTMDTASVPGTEAFSAAAEVTADDVVAGAVSILREQQIVEVGNRL